MKQRKSILTAVLVLLVLAAVSAGCGGAGDGMSEGGGGAQDSDKGILGGNRENAKEEGNGRKDAEDGWAEPERVDTYDYSDIAGCWYAVSEDGRIYMMSMADRGTGNDGSLAFSIRVLDEKKFNYFGDVIISPYTEESGRNRTGCVLKVGLVNGEYEEKYLSANFYDNGSFHVFPPYYMNEEGEIVQNEDLDLVFTRSFPFPSQERNRAEGVLSGVWYTDYEEEYIFLMIQPDGQFLLWQEDSLVTGSSRLDGDALSLTCQYVDGEPYDEGDGVVSGFILDNNDLTFEDILLPAVTGRQVGSWTAAVSSESSGEITYHLELSENGSFRFGTVSSKDGIYREAVGACLYRSDTEIDMLYISNYCDTDFRIRASMTWNPDGSITMKNGQSELHFVKD